MVSVKNIGHRIDFVGEGIPKLIAYFFVIILNFISTLFIKIKIFKKQFVGLNNFFCNPISNFPYFDNFYCNYVIKYENHSVFSHVNQNKKKNILEISKGWKFDSYSLFRILKNITCMFLWKFIKKFWSSLFKVILGKKI